jgi:hypothetical protein
MCLLGTPGTIVPILIGLVALAVKKPKPAGETA